MPGLRDAVTDQRGKRHLYTLSLEPGASEPLGDAVLKGVPIFVYEVSSEVLANARRLQP